MNCITFDSIPFGCIGYLWRQTPPLQPWQIHQKLYTSGIFKNSSSVSSPWKKACVCSRVPSYIIYSDSGKTLIPYQEIQLLVSSSVKILRNTLKWRSQCRKSRVSANSRKLLWLNANIFTPLHASSKSSKALGQVYLINFFNGWQVAWQWYLLNLWNWSNTCLTDKVGKVISFINRS